MAGNTFGTLFRLTTFGESHGVAIGGIIDGCPSGLALEIDAIQAELDRRRPGQSNLTTPRKEQDTVEWLSGVHEGVTTGAPVGFLLRNEDFNSEDYDHLKSAFRPSHADYTYSAKYGHRDHRGGGRSSARETACRVAAGAIARQLLAAADIDVSAYVERVGNTAVPFEPRYFERSEVDASAVRCPDPSTAESMIKTIDAVRKEGDTVGGTVALVGRGIPAGLGDPVFDKFQAVLAHALWSLPAVKSMEIGSGLHGTTMRGSAHNDAFQTDENGQMRTMTNHSGGIQGGITNGEELVVRIGFKPVSTLMKPQASVNAAGEAITLEGKGRHDPCVLPRAVPIVEAMTLLVLADRWLINRAAKL
ncbi:MAG: chorismate synthase [Flavobacteriales bacterium]|nr:chorismate synthase [Flavobacteriales bacterium]